MKKLFISLLALLMTVSSVNAYTVNCGDTLSGIASQFGTTWQEIWENNPQIENPDLIYTGQEILIYPDEKAEVYDDEGNFVLGGAVQPIAGSTYNLSGSGVNSSATSITLNSLTLPQNGYLIQDSDLSTTFYITLEPGNKSRQEIVACTTLTQNSGGTATFSGCSRGMSPITPYTASSTLRFAHAGGTQVIFSDAPQLFNQFASLTDEQTIERIWTFDVHPTASSSIGYATTTYQYATKQYVDNVGAGGFTAANIGDGGTLRANGTSPETMDIATSTSEMVSFEIEDGFFVVSTTTDEKIDTHWNDRYNATTTKSGNFTFSDNLTASGLTKGFSLLGGSGSDSSTSTASSVVIDFSSATTTVLNYTSFTLNAGHTISATNVPAAGGVLIIKVQDNAIINGTIDMSGQGGDKGAGGAAGLHAGNAGTSGYKVGLFDTSNHYGSGGATVTDKAGGGGGGGGHQSVGIVGVEAGGGGGVGGALGAALVNYDEHIDQDLKAIFFACGSGGGGGAGTSYGDDTAGGDGGNGGGIVILEVAGDLTFGAASTITVAGDDGSDGATSTGAGAGNIGSGGGGGGSAGQIYILYNGTLTDGGVTKTVSGGALGSGGAGATDPGGNGGAGGDGDSYIAENRNF